MWAKGATKLACVWFTNPLLGFLRGLGCKEGCSIVVEIKFWWFISFCQIRPTGQIQKALNCLRFSWDTQFVKMPITRSYARPSCFSWHLLLKLFNNQTAFYKKLINGILFGSYVIWNSFHILNFVWHFENTMPNSFVWIKEIVLT